MAGELTRLKRNVYPQLLTASCIPLCGTAGVALGGVMRQSTSDASHQSNHLRLYSSRLAFSFQISGASWTCQFLSRPAQMRSRRTYLIQR